ncbi:MAG: hypothetical protein ABIK20_03700 [Candidatus Omnitrophota bacterium]
MSWCFAIVNNKFAEIYFDRKKNDQIEIKGHCYPKRDEFKTKTEQKWIAQDTKKFRFVYRNKKYYKKTDLGLEQISCNNKIRKPELT